MLKHTTIFGASALALGLATGAMAQDADVTAETVVATVGETEITLGEIIIARTQLPQQYTNLPPELLFDGLIDQLIQQQLLADAAGEISLPNKFLLINERRALMAAQVVDGIAATAINDEDMQAAYQARFADAEEIQEFNAAHLLVDTEEEAAAAKARIDGGEDFADVARDVSTGPTGPNGGNLGWFGPGAMVPEFETAVGALEVGGVTEPFETQFGWHLATLLETRVQPRPTIEELAPQLGQQLREQAVEAFLADLTANQDIVKPEPGAFDPALVDALDLLE